MPILPPAPTTGLALTAVMTSKRSQKKFSFRPDVCLSVGADAGHRITFGYTELIETSARMRAPH